MKINVKQCFSVIIASLLIASTNTKALELVEMTQDERLYELSALYKSANLGSDKNKNGIWDDVESFIKKEKIEGGKKDAMYDYAKKVKDALEMDHSSWADVNQAFERVHSAQVCLKQKKLDAIRMVELFTLATNHPQRSKIYNEAHEFGGPYKPLDKLKGCE